MNNKEMTNTWIYKVDPTIYNIFGAYKKRKVLSWNPYNIKWQKGDIVYMYLGKPLQLIKYKCQVVEVFDYAENKNKFVDDNVFVASVKLNKEKKYVNLKLLSYIESNDLTLKALERLGYKASYGTPQKVEGKILKFIESKK